MRRSCSRLCFCRLSFFGSWWSWCYTWSPSLWRCTSVPSTTRLCWAPAPTTSRAAASSWRRCSAACTTWPCSRVARSGTRGSCPSPYSWYGGGAGPTGGLALGGQGQQWLGLPDHASYLIWKCLVNDWAVFYLSSTVWLVRTVFVVRESIYSCQFDKLRSFVSLTELFHFWMPYAKNEYYNSQRWLGIRYGDSRNYTIDAPFH